VQPEEDPRCSTRNSAVVENTARLGPERSKGEVHLDAEARSLARMVVSTAPPGHLEGRPRFGLAEALMEMLLGCFLLGVATLAGLVFVHRPWPNRVDGIGFRLLPADLSSRWAADVTHLGSLTVLIVGAVVLSVVAGLSRNWIRALSCLIAPIAAVLIVESVAKPLVGRHFEGTLALSYPSGTVAAVAALAAAAFLVVPRFAKPLVAVAGGVVVVAVCAAVVVLRWHYPTDALGGACVGAGAVFAVDGLLLSIRNQRLVRMRSDALGRPDDAGDHQASTDVCAPSLEQTELTRSKTTTGS
jgi:membrane-associated phospholipid phosphatase